MALVSPVTKVNISQTFLGTYESEPEGWVKKVNGIWRGWRAARSGTMAMPKVHEAVDWVCPDGTPVKAVHNGKIVWQGTDSYDGARIIYLEVRRGLVFKCVFAYWHLQPGSFKFRIGDKVKVGQVIALSGHTGNVSGPHLHGELWRMLLGTAVNKMFRTAQRVDPMPFLNGLNLTAIS